MNCSRCATELADNATFCPKCGLSTTPSLARSFSYLPPGTPPWPSSVPAQIPYVVDSKAAPLTVAPPTKTEGKGSSRVLAGVAVLLLVPLLGAFATFGILYANGKVGATQKTTKTSVTSTAIPSISQTPSNVLPAPTSFANTTTSDNSTTQMSLKYPTDWKKQTMTQSSSFSGIDVYSQQIGIEMQIGHYVSALTAQVENAAQLNQEVIQSLPNNYSSVQPVTPTNATPTIANVLWDESDATFIDPQISSTAVQHFTIITTKHNNLYYRITIFAPNGIYQEAIQKYIQPILDSVQFLS